MSNNIPFYFLLGGQDLEMMTIRAMLEENGYVHGQDFLDKQLPWGASWGDYDKEIIELQSAENPIQIVGIELSHKDKMPKNAIDIDHHNERSHEKSSLEQVADLLDVTLTRKQKLIAANDSGYIPAMEKMGASQQEIDDIRLADRQAQGVTQEDEEFAIQAIASAKWEKDVCTIKSLSGKFSPITDRLYGQAHKTLVYTDAQLTYYGCGVGQLAHEFKDYVKGGKAYHGGGDNGYFGIAKDAFPPDELTQIKDKIIKLMAHTYSKHIFLFPFSWRIDGKNEISIIHDKILKDSNWKHDIYQIKDAETYNEQTYFYDFVRKAMYDYGQDDDLFKHYEYELGICPTYTICIKGEDEAIELEVKDIMLNLYKTGVGILSFHLDNNQKEQSYFSTILKINEFGRRLYPQFLDKKSGILGTQGAFLAEKITLNTGKETFTDDLVNAYPPRAEYSNQQPISKIILDILPKGMDAKANIKPILDDRMFVICWYGNDGIIEDLSTFENDTYNYTQSDDWYRFLFVDKNSPTIANRNLKKELLEKHSYERWIEDKQLFGISRYSFMALTKGSDPWIIPNHVVTTYYKMIELTLAQRISALRFGEKATEISKLTGDSREISTQVNDLFKDYIEFQNRIYFREVTAQEQGIEMYDMMQNHMRTERDIKELDQELDELNQYANMLEEKEQTKAANLFAWIAAIFLPASLIAGILGMNTMPDPVADKLFFGESHSPFMWSIGLMVLVTVLILLPKIIKQIIKWTKKWKNRWTKK